MKACFIGHRHITNKKELSIPLNETIQKLIQNGVTIFLFGSMSEFDELAWEIVTKLKILYPSIKRVYVRSSFKNIDKTYEKYLLKSYEETYFPQTLDKAGKCSYIKRNYEMINNSTYCIFYYNENYNPPLKRNITQQVLTSKTRRSGTKIAYTYALKKKKHIINLYKK